MPLSKEANKERMRLSRLHKDGAQNHPILEALVDPVKRNKLESICRELKTHHVSEQVFYGCWKPIRFDEVGELLEVTS